MNALRAAGMNTTLWCVWLLILTWSRSVCVVPAAGKRPHHMALGGSSLPAHSTCTAYERFASAKRLR